MTNLDRSRLSGGRLSAAARGPGYQRLSVGGLFLAVAGLATISWLVLAAVQSLGGAQHVFADVAQPSLLSYLVELPIAALSVVGGAALWLRLWTWIGLLAALAWVALGVETGITGGGFDGLVLEGALLLVIASGAWARRVPTTKPGSLGRP